MYQSGFTTNHSRDACLDHLTDFDLTDTVKETYTSMTLADLQKGFDS